MRGRPEEYLVTTKVGRVTRKFVWHGHDIVHLDLPHTWAMRKHGGKIEIRDLSSSDDADELVLDELLDGEGVVVKLPRSPHSRLNRPITMNLVKLRPIRPVYTNSPTPAALKTRNPRQRCVFYGQRYFLIRYRPVGSRHLIRLGSIEVAEVRNSSTGFVVTALQDGLKCNVGGHRSVIRQGESAILSEVDFHRACFILGVHWWRFRMVPTPDGQPPIETDETDEDLQEQERLRQSAIGFLSIFIAFMVVVFLTSLLQEPKPKIVKADIIIQKPLIVPPPKMAEKKPEPPPPPPPPPKVEPPPPQEVAKEKPKKEKPAPPKKVAKRKKPEPAPKIVRQKPPTPKVAKAPKPPAEKAPPPPPQKIVKEAPPAQPSPAELRAKEQAAQQAQLLKSLNFISSSKNRPAADPTTYDTKEGKFATSAMVGGMASKSNTLDKLAKNAAGDGSINTRSARTISNSVSFGKGKGLNDVQGKVSLGQLASSDGVPGESLGGGRGIEMSGPGQISESMIEKALAKFLARFQYCYEKALLTNMGLSGTLTLQWTITAAGKVADAKVIKSQLNSNDLHNCVTGVLKEVPFPKPGGGSVQVKKVFTFSSTNI